MSEGSSSRGGLPGGEPGPEARADGRVEVALRPSLLGLEPLLAAGMCLFGLGGSCLAAPGGALSQALARGLCWGMLAAGAAVAAVGLARPRPASPRLFRLAAAALLACGFALALAAAGAPEGMGPGVVMALGALAAACAAPAAAAWVGLYAGAGAWGAALHLACSLCLAGVLYLVGAPWRGASPASWAFTAVLALAGCACLALARGGFAPREAPAPAAAAAEPEPADGARPLSAARTGCPGRSGRPARPERAALAAFARTQWSPLVCLGVLALVHGLRWESELLGETSPKLYETPGWEFALGPVLGMAFAWAVLTRSPAGSASPQRTSCQALLPVGVAVMLLVPVLNPLFGFYSGVDVSAPVFVALEVVLDVLNEAAVAILEFSAALSLVASVRLTGLAALPVSGAALVAAGAGGLLGLYGYGVVGSNGTIVCFLIWTAYLLAMGLALLGQGKDERDGRRLGEGSVDNILRRRAREIARERGLSPREEEVLRYLARGHSYTYTAQDFYLSENTVRTHAKHSYAKLGIAKREELFRLFDEAPGGGGAAGGPGGGRAG